MKRRQFFKAFVSGLAGLAIGAQLRLGPADKIEVLSLHDQFMHEDAYTLDSILFEHMMADMHRKIDQSFFARVG